jgi:GNAT superfamily N-acetyltransferase
MEFLAINKGNVDDCVDIFIKAYNQSPWNCNWTFDKAKIYLSEHISNLHFVGFLLYDNKLPVAAMFGRKKTWWTNDQLMIDEFFVSPEKQRLGYGKKLMIFCNQYAHDNQIELMALMTNQYMPAFKFYNQIGYTAADQYVFMFKQGA